MSRVFIVQEPLQRRGSDVRPRIDYNTLRPYGDLKFIFGWSELRDSDWSTPRFVWKLRDVLKDFSDQDYLVCLGNPALCAMAVTIATECNNGSCRILDWIRDEQKYRVLDFDLHCQPVQD